MIQFQNHCIVVELAYCSWRDVMTNRPKCILPCGNMLPFSFLALFDNDFLICFYKSTVGFCDGRFDETSGIVDSAMLLSPSFERPDNDFCSLSLSDARFGVP